MSDSSPRGFLANFPVAAQGAQETRPNDLLGNPLYRYWAVLRDQDVVAAFDTDGNMYVGRSVFFAPDLYHRHNRNLLTTTAMLLADAITGRR